MKKPVYMPPMIIPMRTAKGQTSTIARPTCPKYLSENFSLAGDQCGNESCWRRVAATEQQQRQLGGRNDESRSTGRQHYDRFRLDLESRSVALDSLLTGDAAAVAIASRHLQLRLVSAVPP